MIGAVGADDTRLAMLSCLIYSNGLASAVLNFRVLLLFAVAQ